MRVVIAQMKHETNTFSPVPTAWARFEEWGAHFGEQAMLAYEHVYSGRIGVAAESTFQVKNFLHKAGGTIWQPVSNLRMS